MIIKVRISPMERWCPYMRSRARHFPQLDYTKMPGVLVEIETESITQAELCDAKMWKATFKRAAERRKVAGIRLGRFTVMLNKDQIESINEFWDSWIRALGKNGAGDYLVVVMRDAHEKLRTAIQEREAKKKR